MSDEPKNTGLSRLPPLDLDAMGANAQDGEILEPEPQLNKGLTPEEDAVYEQMHELLTAVTETAKQSNSVVIRSADFSYGKMGLDTFGVLGINSNKQKKQELYGVDVNSEARTIRIKHEAENSYSYASDGGTGPDVHVNRAPTETVLEGGLDETGRMDNETLQALSDHIAERHGLDPVALWAMVQEGDIIDAAAAPPPVQLDAPTGE